MIPLFLTLTHKICFMAASNLADRTLPQIFKDLKEMYQYYLQRGFHITAVHSDGACRRLIHASKDLD
jgi:hypothetical protein